MGDAEAEMKNVLFFTHNLNKGGAEKTVRTLSAYINANVPEMKSYVCVVYDDDKMHDRVENLIVMQHKSRPEDSKLKKAINQLKQVAEMRKIKKDYGIDVCISFLPGADFINVLSGVGEQQIVSVRNEESYFAKHIFKKLYVKYSYVKCNRIVALSERVRQDVIHNFGIKPEKVSTIHCAASQEKESIGCNEEFARFVEGKKVFINVGRLDSQKGQVHLLRAFKKVSEQVKDAVLVILGEGELYSILLETASQLGIADKVLLMGNQFNPADYLKKSDVFVLSSNVEGMPNVLVEAMQCDLPVVSTDCGAAKETLAPQIAPGTKIDKVVVGEYGVLVPTCETMKTKKEFAFDLRRDNTPEENIMAEGMIKLIEDQELLEKYRALSKEYVRQFDQDLIMKLWVDAIREA